MIGMKKLAAVAVAAALAGTAGATDNAYKPGYKAVTTWVTEYETVCETIHVDVVKSVPYEKQVTKYDHCGKPYCVTVTAYKDVTVKVPKVVHKQVARKVAVVKWVKVCDY